MTPGVDLTASGDSLQTNRGLDPLIPDGSSPAFGMYASGHDLTDPYVSPLYGDFTKGFPPTILSTGRATCSSPTPCACTAPARAGIPADLHVTEAGGHGGFFGMAPEDRQLEQEIRRFVDSHWPSAALGRSPGRLDVAADAEYCSHPLTMVVTSATR